MAKNIKEQLAAKAEENTRRHHESSYVDDFDIGRQHVTVAIDLIDPNPWQPRLIYRDTQIEKLARSISVEGLLQPVILRKVKGDRYQMIAGECRKRAHLLLKKSRIEALVISASDEQCAALSLIENIDRSDLSDFEIGMSLVKMQTTFTNRSKLAESFGMQRSDLYRYLSYSQLPPEYVDRLHERPELLSRTAASDVVKAIKESEARSAESLKTLLAKLAKAWSKLEEGTLEQTKLASIISASSDSDIPSPIHTVLHSKGKKVGTIGLAGKNVVVKISAQAINAEQKSELEQFLTSLLK